MLRHTLGRTPLATPGADPMCATPCAGGGPEHAPSMPVVEERTVEGSGGFSSEAASQLEDEIAISQLEATLPPPRYSDDPAARRAAAAAAASAAAAMASTLSEQKAAAMAGHAATEADAEAEEAPPPPGWGADELAAEWEEEEGEEGEGEGEGEGGLLDEYTLAEGGAGGDEAEEGARRRIGPEAHTHEGRAALLRSEVRSVP